MIPTFSLLHITARLPEGWRPAWRDWSSKCANRDAVEYLLVTDLRDDEKPIDLHLEEGVIPFFRLVNSERPCTVDAWNMAAKWASGQILVCVADDWFPCERWDEKLLYALPDLSKEAVVWVGCDFQPNLIISPILTRAYYERPGRGGCPNGELLYPEYISVGSDDDFTEYALRDGVVVNAKHLRFEHRHVSNGQAPDDEVYRWSNRAEAWEVKERVLARRRAEGFAR